MSRSSNPSVLDVSRAVARDLAPAWLRTRVQAFLLTRRAQQLRQRAQHQTAIEDIVESAFTSGAFRPNQIRSEVTELVRALALRQPRRVLEIGSQGGGNLFLLTRAAAADAKVLSIDVNYSPVQMAAYPSFAAPTQTLTCLQADSTAAETIRRVKEWLGSDRLDFLFIDGDHRLAGVTADFQNYAPLVADGGMIGLHDIVPDHTTRYGRQTIAVAGDVPVFWNQLKAQYPHWQELIEDPEQDGAGIGLVPWTRG